MAFFLVTLAAGCLMPARSPEPYVPDPGPAVDERCLGAAAEGHLLADAPAEIGAFRVSPEPNGLYLRRPGRAVTAAEGKAAFDSLALTGWSGGHRGVGSIYKCADVPDVSCLTVHVWLCQTSWPRLAAELEAAFAKAGASDGELGVHVEVHEARGRACKNGAACVPAAHYSVPSSRATSAPRVPVGGRGRCANDGDCEGAHSNRCESWYLRGGVENAIYISWRSPTLCGCVDQLCTWFQQPSGGPAE